MALEFTFHSIPAAATVGKDFIMIISIATTEASIIIATICPVFICASAGVSFLFFVLHILHTRKFLYIFFQLYFMAVVSKK